MGKTCLICKEELDFDAFNKDPTRKDGHSPWCRGCTKKYKQNYYLKNKEKLLENSKSRRLANIEKIREYDRIRGKETKRRLRNRDTWRGKSVSLIASMRASSKERGYEWCDEWWNADDLAKRIENGYCERTGIQFELLRFINELYKTNPLAPSVDRIDNTKGYHPGNVQIVTWFYNNMKRDHPQELIDDLIDVIVANYVISQMKT